MFFRQVFGVLPEKSDGESDNQPTTTTLQLLREQRSRKAAAAPATTTTTEEAASGHGSTPTLPNALTSPRATGTSDPHLSLPPSSPLTISRSSSVALHQNGTPGPSRSRFGLAVLDSSSTSRQPLSPRHTNTDTEDSPALHVRFSRKGFHTKNRVSRV